MFSWRKLKEDWGASFYSRYFKNGLCPDCLQRFDVVAEAQSRNRKRLMLFILSIFLLDFVYRVTMR